MLKLRRTGRFLSVTALAASTALSGPFAALAQEAEQPPSQIQDAPPEVVQPPVEAPAEEPAPPPAAEPAPAPEAAPEPAPEPEPAAPAMEEPAPAETPPAEEPAPAPEPPEATPPSETQSAPDTGAPRNAPEGNPAELPADAGTQNDIVDEPAGSPDQSAPAPETPAVAPEAPPPETPAAESAPTPSTDAPATPPVETGETPAAPQPPSAPIPPAPPAPGAEPTTPQGDPASGAAPAAPPTAPTDSGVRPAAPGAAPVEPGTPPAPPAPSDTVTPPPAGTAPGAPPPSPGAAPGAPPAPVGSPPQAAAPPPAANPQPVAADIQTAPVPQGGVGANDARVQQLTQPVEVRPVTAVEGQRIEAAPQAVLPPNVQVIERVGDRDILSLVGAGVAGAAAGGLAAYFIKSNDNERLARGSDDVSFERLPRGLTRETIRRPNGVQVVTIENEYGDVIQRSRIMPDGREIVLFYDPYAEDADRPDYYRDAGADLPPLRLEIPDDRYIVDIEEPDEDLYYDTIVAPPVETVERIYSLDEVRRSPRIRDKVRRIDLNTINFAFGSAAIEQAEVDNLQALADAVKRVIDDNPGEVFLLEGHTDAVGSNVANLALSDRRAESVASALSEYFEIPSENLVTQGYGEEDLKVDTQAASRENRRVTLRRITALVKPVVSAQAN